MMSIYLSIFLLQMIQNNGEDGKNDQDGVGSRTLDLNGPLLHKTLPI